MVATKSTVYLETSIISYLTSRPSRDLVVAARQTITREWWTEYKDFFSLTISKFVWEEAAMGDKDAVKKRLEILAGIPQLPSNDASIEMAKRLLEKRIVPAKALIDAMHMAVASANGIQYLLTWNCAHIANAIMRPKIEAVARECGFRPTIICTPEELMRK